MKTYNQKRSALLACGVVIGGLLLFCFLWVRKEQRQYALNRQLIVTLMKNDTKFALALVNLGADPNTRLEPSPAPTLPQLANQLLRRSPSPVNESPTALMLVCGARFKVHPGRGGGWNALDENLPLLQAMLLHSTNIDVRASQPLFRFHDRAIQNYTALHYAARMRYEGTMALLLQHGADLNAQDIRGRTPLMLAAPYGTVPMIRALFAHGANPNAQDNGGMTALAIAVASFYPKTPILELLVHGSDPNLSNDSGETPLMKVQDPQLAALLLQYGADINARDKKGRSVLYHVQHYFDDSTREPSEYRDIVAFLRKHGAKE